MCACGACVCLFDMIFQVQLHMQSTSSYTSLACPVIWGPAGIADDRIPPRRRIVQTQLCMSLLHV